MVKKIRKPLALFLALVMCLSMVNFTALANETAGHEHNKDGWTCTQAEPVKTLNCEEDHEHTDDCYTVTEGEWTCTAPVVVEETPAEVTAFLSAVAGIPAITAENAAEVAEYVYGPVSEAYEALLSTGYEERADVLEATAAYAAAIDAVDAALNMESDNYLAQISGKTPTDRFYYNGVEVAQLYEGTYPLSTTYQYSNPATGIEIFVGDPGNYQYLYTKMSTCHCGTVLVEETPDWITVDSNRKLTDSNPGIIQGKPTWNLSGYVAEDWTDYGYEGYPSLQINVVGAKPGNTSIRFQAYQAYDYLYTWQKCNYCGQVYSQVGFNGWIEDTQTLNVMVNARYQLNYNLNGGTGSISPTYTDSTETSAAVSITSTVPTHPEGKTFKGWKDENGNMVSGSVTLNWSEGLGSKSNPVSKTLTAVWEDTKTYTVTYTDGVVGVLVFPDQGYEGLKEGDATPKFVGTPTREGYTFMGWAPAVKSKVAAADANTNGEIIYTATWKKNEIPTTYTIVHEYYTNNTKDGETKQENVSGKNVGDTVKVADITKNLTYKKGNETYTYTYTRANKGVVADNPYGYSLGAVITELTLAESGNIIVLRYDRTTTPPVTNPSLTKLEKVRVTDETQAPAGTPSDVEYGAVIFRSDDQKVKLLYKITVTGTEGAAYKVTDMGAEWVSGGASHSKEGNTLVITGTIAEGETTAVIYVTKEFGAADIEDNKLTNNAELVSNGTTENPTDGPSGDNGKDGDNSDASEKRNVTINFKTDDGEPLKDSYNKDYDKGGAFDGINVNKPTNARKAAPRATAETIVIPWTIEKGGNTYVLDEVASAQALEDLKNLTTVTEDVVKDIIYSLDMVGGNDTTKPDGGSDGIPDKYQVKVTFKVVHGKWNDETNADVVKYVVKYAADGVTMDKNGTATLGNIIPAVGNKPDDGFTTGSWDTKPTAVTTVTEYTYTYKAVIIPDPEYKVTVDPANGEDKTETTVKKNDEFTVPAAPTAPEGKEFDGWKGSDGKDYKPGDKITVTGDLTLTAQWKDKTYTVTFNSNGGSAVEGQTVKHGDKATRPADPTRDGYTFNGWTLNGQPYDFTTPVTGDITLVAQWTQNSRPVDPDPDYTYTLNYNANGGVGAPASQSQINSRNFTVSAVEPTREGYTFAGWATTAGAETAAYQPGSQLRINNGFSLTLFAVWTPEEDVNETEPPLVETPDVTETPDEGEDLGDNDTPLTELPDETEPPVEPTETPDETEDLGDNDTPLAEVPQTGDSIGLWIVLTLCSAAGLYCFFPKKKKGQREA